MAISRIKRIDRYRIFRRFVWPDSGVPDFDRYNLIYGWNGVGKTSLSQIFKCLETRSSLDLGVAEFLVDGRSVRTDALATADLPQVRVFNRDSVSRTVLESASPTVPLIYVLGENSTKKQVAMEALKAERDALEKEIAEKRKTQAAAESALEELCTDRARDIRTLLTAPGGAYNTFDARRLKERLRQARQAAGPTAALSDLDLQRCKATIGAKPKEVVEPINGSFPDVLSISKEVHRCLQHVVEPKAVLEGLSDLAISGWINDGIPLHTGEHTTNTCRFCAQVLPPSRMQDLLGHFNDDVRNHQTDIDAVAGRVAESIRFLEAVRVPPKGVLYEHLADPWEEAASRFTEARNAATTYLESLQSALNVKRKMPFKTMAMPIGLGGEAASAASSWLDVAFQIGAALVGAVGAASGRQSLSALNSLITEHATYTANYNREVTAAREALAKDAVARTLVPYAEREDRLRMEQEGLAAINKRLMTVNSEIDRLGSEIRDARKPAEDLNRDLAAYLGRTELTFVVKDNGYAVSRGEDPATHLSEGERTAVAFIYFLRSLLDEEFDLKSGVVVIDDPVSSLDSNGLYNAFSFMKERIPPKEAFSGQLFILTHNFAFFRAVKNWFSYMDRNQAGGGNLPLPKSKQRARYYTLVSSSDNGVRCGKLTRMDDLLYKFESEYHYLFSQVMRAASASAEDLEALYDLPNIGRRLVEAMLSFKYPGVAGQLYQQLDRVSGFDEAKKTRLIRFTNVHSHGTHLGEVGGDLSILAESQGVMKDILDLIRHVDESHYESMAALVQGEQATARAIGISE